MPCKNVGEIKAFLGPIVFYRQLMKNFAKMKHPLDKLIKKDVPCHWKESQKQDF